MDIWDLEVLKVSLMPESEGQGEHVHTGREASRGPALGGRSTCRGRSSPQLLVGFVLPSPLLLVMIRLHEVRQVHEMHERTGTDAWGLQAG